MKPDEVKAIRERFDDRMRWATEPLPIIAQDFATILPIAERALASEARAKAAEEALAEALLNPDPWRGIEELPEEWKDGRWIEAVVAESADDGARLTPGRVFVIRHDGVTQSGYNMGWSVYPGYGGAHDRTFSHFRELKGPGHA